MAEFLKMFKFRTSERVKKIPHLVWVLLLRISSKIQKKYLRGLKYHKRCTDQKQTSNFVFFPRNIIIPYYFSKLLQNNYFNYYYLYLYYSFMKLRVLQQSWCRTRSFVQLELAPNITVCCKANYTRDNLTKRIEPPDHGSRS